MEAITTPTSRAPGVRPRRRGGFTLIEAALTTMIVGLGTVAMMGLFTTGVSTANQAANLTTAVDLAENIHEACDRLPFAASNNAWGIPNGSTIATLMTGNSNITWLDGQTFSPPIDATGTSVRSLSGWSQVVSVNSVSPTNVSVNAATKNTATYPMSRVTVTINHGSIQQFQTCWLVVQ
jgi:Tfp pilus assembly protein PilV